MHFVISNLGTAYITLAVALITTAITYLTGGEDNRFEGVPEGEESPSVRR